jgi:hypothetical protein
VVVDVGLPNEPSPPAVSFSGGFPCTFSIWGGSTVLVECVVPLMSDVERCKVREPVVVFGTLDGVCFGGGGKGKMHCNIDLKSIRP